MKSSLALIRSSGLDIGAVGVCIIRTYVACIWPSAGLALIRVIFSFFIARRDIRERERERRRTRCRIHTQRVVNIWYYEGTSAANFKFFFLSFSFPGTSAGLFIWSFLMTKMRLIDTLGRWGNARPRGFFFFLLVTRAFVVNVFRAKYSQIGRQVRMKLIRTKHEDLSRPLNMMTSTLDISYTMAGSLDISYIFVYYRQYMCFEKDTQITRKWKLNATVL